MTTLTTFTTPCGVTLAFDRQRFDDGASIPESIWALTDCCHAATTGTTDGIVCKSCGREAETFDGDIESVLAAHHCPCPQTCADTAVWALTR